MAIRTPPPSTSSKSKQQQPQQPPPLRKYEAKTLSKRNSERFFLKYSIYWISLMAFVVITSIYESFTDTHYYLLGFAVCLPAIIVPLLLPSYCDDASLPLSKRYTTKANIWIGIYSFIGNYFCTHYFYNVLGVRFTFLEEERWNDVPVVFFLLTHGYFHFYHVLSSRFIRVVWRSLHESDTSSIITATSKQSKVVVAVGGTRENRTTVGVVISWIITVVAVFMLAISTAFMEAFTLLSFPYYEYPDTYAMLTTGSVFYALYFLLSFPGFYRLDEEEDEVWTVRRTVWDCLAVNMGIIMLLEAWRVCGPQITEGANRGDGLVWAGKMGL